MTHRSVLLGDVCELVQTGKTPPTSVSEYFDGTINWFTPGDIGKTKHLAKSKRTISDAAVVDKKATLFPANSLLLTCIGEIGRCGVIRESASSNQQITCLKFDESVNVDYAYYWFLHNKKHLEGLSNAAVVPILNNRALKQLPFKYPTPEAQQRIANTLDTADALRRKDQELLEKYDELAQSIFYEMFDGKHAAETADKCLTLVGGAAFQSTDFVDQGLPVIRIGTINKGYFDKQQLVFLPIEHRKTYHRYVVQPGDLLMTLTGTVGKDDYGNVFVLDESYPAYFLNQRVTKLEFDRAVFTTEYLQYYFKQKTVKDKLTGISRGVRQANISNKDIYALNIPVPSLGEQKQFSKALQLLHASSSAVIQSRSETLFTGLLSKYFA